MTLKLLPRLLFTAFCTDAISGSNVSKSRPSCCAVCMALNRAGISSGTTGLLLFTRPSTMSLSCRAAAVLARASASESGLYTGLVTPPGMERLTAVGTLKPPTDPSGEGTAFGRVGASVEVCSRLRKPPTPPSRPPTAPPMRPDSKAPSVSARSSPVAAL